MQSDGNSFCGDFALDSLNMAYKDKDSILDQNMKSKYFWIFIMKILNFKNYEGKCTSKEKEHNKELMKSGFSAFRMMLLRVKSIIIKIRKYFLLRVWFEKLSSFRDAF